MKAIKIAQTVDCFGKCKVVRIRKTKIKVERDSVDGSIISEWIPLNSLSLKV